MNGSPLKRTLLPAAPLRSIVSIFLCIASSWACPAIAHAAFVLEGTSRAMVEPNTVGEPQIAAPVAHEVLTAGGQFQGRSDEAGHYTIEVPQDAPYLVVARLRGLYCDVVNDGGPSAVISRYAHPGEPADILFDDTNSLADERDAYVHVNVIHDWIKAVDSTFTALDYPLTVHVNNSMSTCGGMWTPSGLIFYREGGGCSDAARISDLVYHEYAHGITRGLYSPAAPPTASGMDEAFSDIAAMGINNDPQFGEGFFAGGGWIRTGENLRQYPGAECAGDPFCLGEILSGAMWKFRKNLNIRYGPEVAGPIFDSLHVQTMKAKETTMPNYLARLLMNDDDDGNLFNGTPHYYDICDAFAIHNLPCPPLTDYVEVRTEPLDDAQGQDDYAVTATAISEGAGAIDPNKVEIHYALLCGPDDTPIWRIASMAPTGNPDEYRGSIPRQSSPYVVRYYIRAEKYSGVFGTAPPQAPYRASYEFMTGPWQRSLVDDLEADRGWTLRWAGDDATAGFWERVDPVGKTSGTYGPTQPEDDHTAAPGALCFVTDGSGGIWSAGDVDNGITSVVSPQIPGLQAGALGSITFWAFFFDVTPPDDTLRCAISYDEGASWRDITKITGLGLNQWTRHKTYIQRRSGSGPVRFRFTMEDRNSQTTCAEAAIDDIEVRWGLAAGCFPAGVDAEPGRLPLISLGSANPSCALFVLHFAQARSGPAEVVVYDPGGRVVRRLLDGPLDAGSHAVAWDGFDQEGRRVGSGVYFLRARSAREESRRTLVLIR